LVSSKVGTRLVHGRSAAGGQSQQRFARRRENQAASAIGAAADTAVKVLVPYAERLDAVGVGGDRRAGARAPARGAVGPVGGRGRGGGSVEGARGGPLPPRPRPETRGAAGQPAAVPRGAHPPERSRLTNSQAHTGQTLKPRARSCSRPSSVILSGPQGGSHTQ